VLLLQKVREVRTPEEESVGNEEPNDSETQLNDEDE
jgi:hypothetical protein